MGTYTFTHSYLSLYVSIFQHKEIHTAPFVVATKQHDPLTHISEYAIFCLAFSAVCPDRVTENDTKTNRSIGIVSFTA